MRRAVAGDDQAYSELLKRLPGMLRAALVSKLQRYQLSTGDLDDILQETLIAFHAQRHRWDTSLPVMPWVVTIAKNKIVDELRRRRRHHVLPGKLAELAVSVSATAEESLARYDVERLIKALPERNQEIVAGISLNGDSARDLAKKLDMLEATVRVIHHRSLKRMAKSLKK
ncbi:MULTISPECIES: sigma-70 family RNA polymerase sigma factor [unclassified Hyphomicrobium]|uniref:sigma-70 family RNA polymerase sigma factor n=1 Tax=unclassified Hyphomicrobium TaxID=2619925 RepID=UPI000213D41E|nr:MULTISPECIES: sigma-70 family RNA polymerase sigma factor [unclassified Hyphomicrobium]CCB68078.1 RNA polymerase, sigma-24 subunit, ECF subfamily [Hyphomicrobium sp. MC1]